MRASPWQVLISILSFVVLLLGKQQTLWNASVSSQRWKENSSLFNIVTLSSGFRHFQTLSDSQLCSPGPIDKADSYCNDSFQCCTTRIEDSSTYFNVVFWECKKSCTSCTYSTSRVWVCWLPWREPIRETITWKKLVQTMLTTKMATTLDHVTGARLSWTNK